MRSYYNIKNPTFPVHTEIQFDFPLSRLVLDIAEAGTNKIRVKRILLHIAPLFKV